MVKYRIEYREKRIPGLLYKYATGTEELLSILLKLKYFDKLESFDNVKIYSNWKKKSEKNLTFLSKFGII